MFTGIITDVIDVVDSKKTPKGLSLSFKKPVGWKDLALGESVSTNGVCLTVAEINKHNYGVFLMPETLSKTTFGVEIPKQVNVERAMQLGDRLGGHIVQGHIDDIGTVKAVDKSDGYRLAIEFAPEFEKFVINKGSITVDGVSLTVASLDKTTLQVALVPHTIDHTTLGALKTGDSVNLEFDALGKYILKEKYANS